MYPQTPLMRLCNKYFGYFGVPYIETHWSNCFSVLTMLWNVSIVIAVTYTMVTMDSFNISERVLMCSIVKPLFMFLAKISVTYIFPYIFLIDMIYLFHYAVPVFRLLDSTCFHRVYHSEGQARALFGIIIFINSFIFVSFLGKKFQDGKLLSEWQLSTTVIVTNLLRYGCVFIIGWYQYANCFILHYYQHGTLQLLRQIKASLTSSSVSVAQEDAALKEIRTLALVNQQLNQILSWPMALYILLHVFNFTLNACVLLICRINTFLMVHSFLIWLYLAYLAWINCQVLKTLKHISTTMRERYVREGHHYNNNNTNSRLFISSRQPIKYSSSNSSSTTIMSNIDHQTRLIRFQQLELYRRYFRIKVFHLASLDVTFILQIALFILNYVVLLTQTS